MVDGEGRPIHKHDENDEKIINLTEVCNFCMMSHPLEVRVKQRLLLDNLVDRSQTMQQQG